MENNNKSNKIDEPTESSSSARPSRSRSRSRGDADRSEGNIPPDEGPSEIGPQQERQQQQRGQSGESIRSADASCANIPYPHRDEMLACALTSKAQRGQSDENIPDDDNDLDENVSHENEADEIEYVDEVGNVVRPGAVSVHGPAYRRRQRQLAAQGLRSSSGSMTTTPTPPATLSSSQNSTGVAPSTVASDLMLDPPLLSAELVADPSTTTAAVSPVADIEAQLLRRLQQRTDEMEERIRQDILNNTVSATSAEPLEPLQAPPSRPFLSSFVRTPSSIFGGGRSSYGFGGYATNSSDGDCDIPSSSDSGDSSDSSSTLDKERKRKRRRLTLMITIVFIIAGVGTGAGIGAALGGPVDEDTSGETVRPTDQPAPKDETAPPSPTMAIFPTVTTKTTSPSSRPTTFVITPYPTPTDYDGPDTCTLCSDGTPVDASFASIAFGTTTCQDFETTLVTYVPFNHVNCTAGQAAGYLACGCPTYPKHAREETTTCPLCADRADPVTETTLCNDFTILNELIGDSRVISCEETRSSFRRACVCPEDVEVRVQQIKEIVRPLSGDTIDDDTPQALAVYWLAEADPSPLDLTTVTNQQVLDRYVAVLLYMSWNGVGWTSQANFLSADSVCGWNDGAFGLFCNGSGFVRSVSFRAHNNLVGSIPSELVHYTRLQEIRIVGNRLFGTIPKSLGQLVRLVNVDLSDNNLNGAIPSQLMDLASLSTFVASRNSLNKPLPASYGPNLRELTVRENSIRGSIPPALGSHRTLQQIDLTINSLTGPVPDFAPDSPVWFLGLSYNELTGTIPLSVTSAPNLAVFHAGNNSLSGPIPSFAGNKGSLERLELFDLPALEGGVDSILNSTNLFKKFKHLQLGNNDLSGTIATTLGQFTSLTYLNLNGNAFVGSLPSEVGALTNLVSLKACPNQLGGSLPTELGNLSTSLEQLFLCSNNFVGAIPSELGSLSALTDLAVDYNLLTGTIPSTFQNLTKLSQIWTSNNMLSGSVNDIMSMLSPTLILLVMQDNMLDGTIPAVEGIGRLSNLQALNLVANNIIGTIPTEIGIPTRLQDLRLLSNSLAGTLPSQMGQLTSLTFLSVARNTLDQALPPSISSLINLQTIDLQRNLFTGDLSPLENLPFLREIYVHGNLWDSVNQVCNGKVLTGHTSSATYFFAANYCDATDNANGQQPPPSTTTCDCCNFCCQLEIGLDCVPLL